MTASLKRDPQLIVRRLVSQHWGNPEALDKVLQELVTETGHPIEVLRYFAEDAMPEIEQQKTRERGLPLPEAPGDTISLEAKTSERPSQSSQSSPDNDPVTPSLEVALEIAHDAIGRCGDDPGVLGSEPVLRAIRVIREEAPEEWFRLRVTMKKAKPDGVLLTDIDKMTAPPKGDGDDNDSIASELVDLVLHKADLFHDIAGDAFATVKDGESEQTLKIDTRSFSDWVSYSFYKATAGEQRKGTSASETALRTAKVTLSGIARHDGQERRVHLRAAPWQNGYLIDMGDDQWRCIEVLPTGWRVLTKSPERFWRTSAMRPLPVPVAGGDLSLLWKFVNVASQGRLLLLAWLLEAWRPDTPFPLAEIIAEQGRAKSFSQNAIRSLIDPHAVNLRAAPKSVEDLFVSAGCNWLASYNNVSHLSKPMQDALCNLATGGGYSARTLYTNSEETTIEVKRPVIINGIVPLVTAQDLIDRVIHLELPPLSSYLAETALEAEFSAAMPSILGGLLDLFVLTLRQLPDVRIDRPPRMADFATLGEAMVQATGGRTGAFLERYLKNRRASIARGMEGSPVAVAIRELVASHSGSSPVVFHGNMKALLTELERYRDLNESWPKSPRGLSDAIRRQRPALKTVGIDIVIGAHGREGVMVEVKRSADCPDGDDGDDGDDGLEVFIPAEKYRASDVVVEDI